MDCYLDSSGCVVCPEIAPTAGRPAHVVTDLRTGWNAGANSIKQLAGDVHVVVSFDAAPAGIMLGFKTSRKLATEPTLLDHAFYLYSKDGRPYVEVRERGAKIGAAQAYTLGKALEIRRVGGQITYWIDGVLLMTRPARSRAALVVNTCLYAAGDTIP